MSYPGGAQPGNSQTNSSGRQHQGNQDAPRGRRGKDSGRGRGRGSYNHRESENWGGQGFDNQQGYWQQPYHSQNYSYPGYDSYGSQSGHGQRPSSRDRFPQYGNRKDRSPSWGRGGRRGEDDSLVFLSKTLSSILRHNAERFGFKLMKGGFLYVDEILYKVHKLRGFTQEDVNHVVNSNDKQRFTLEKEEDGRFKIRANQGHSLEVDDLALTPITSADDFPIVIHGTYFESWEMIKQSGLNRMKRNHIHFAPGEPGQGGVISGMRSSCQVMIYLNLEKALKDGIKFFRSANNVILSPGDKDGVIHPRYFVGAVDRRGGYSRLEFNPDIDTKSDRSNKRKNDKNDWKSKKGRKGNKQSEGAPTYDTSSTPPKVQVSDQGAKSAHKSRTPEEASTSKEAKPVQKSGTPEEASTSKEAKPIQKSVTTEESATNYGADTAVNTVQTEPASTEHSRGLSQIENEYKSDDEDPTGSNVEEAVAMETVVISDPDVSKCTVDELIDKKPPYVVVMCCGESLGEKESCIKELVVGTGANMYIFDLKDKALMDKGHIVKLLMDINIEKIFFRIAEASKSLINEYEILMNGVPIWDIELLHEKMLGQLPEVDTQFITKDLAFHKKMFKKWAKKCQHPSTDEEAKNELREQAKIIYRMYPLLKKSTASADKSVRAETFKQAIPSGADHFLAEKIKQLKLDQKRKDKKPKPENNHEKKDDGRKPGVKDGGGARNNKKGKNRKK